MALNEQQIAQAVELLAGSHKEKLPLAALPDDCLPATAADAMAIQMALNEINGVVPGGWKVGFTSAALLEKAGAIGPMLGAMPKRLCRTSPATFSRRDFTLPVIEFEIGYRMGADLPPREAAYTETEVLAAVDSAIIGIEIADPHYEEVFSQPIPSLIADNGVAGGFIAGPDIPDWRERDLADIAIASFADGEQVGEGFERDARCDAAWVLTWTANKVAQYGAGLKTGEYVTTGAAAPPAFLGEESEWQGRFDGVGEVTVRFTD
jgi:2-keto-4-pentenoate hydratase